MFHIYTDGSCLKNPNGPSAWAFIFVEPSIQEELYLSSGFSPNSTNNRMELTAIIEAIEFIPFFPLENDEFIIYTDSLWAKNCALGEWKRKANLDLWNRYDNATRNISVPITIKWVKAHNGNKFNEAVDSLARQTAQQLI